MTTMIWLWPSGEKLTIYDREDYNDDGNDDNNYSDDDDDNNSDYDWRLCDDGNAS